MFFAQYLGANVKDGVCDLLVEGVAESADGLGDVGGGETGGGLGKLGVDVLAHLALFLGPELKVEVGTVKLTIGSIVLISATALSSCGWID